MECGQLSAGSIRELAARFTAALTEVAPALATGDLDEIEACLQQVSRHVFGHVVAAVVTARNAAQSAQPHCPQCQQALRRVDPARPRQVQGLVGEYRLVRAYFVCAACHRGTAPLDADLGLGAGALAPGLSRVASRLGIELAFESAAAVLAETLGVSVAAEAVRRVTEGIGDVAETEAQAVIARAQAGDDPLAGAVVAAGSSTLLVAVDGTMVHRDGAWHEVKAGVVAPVGPRTRLDPETGRRYQLLGSARYCAGTEAAEPFWYRVYVTACQHGLGSQAVRTVVVLGDGAEWIWRHAARFLGLPHVEIIEIVDYYHAVEHLWTVAQAVFGAGSPAAVAWVQPLKRRLLTDGAGAVLTALEHVASTTAVAADAIDQARGYFTTHAARLDYPRFLARQLPIGSGVVESACKTLIGARAKGAGMRWSRAGLGAVLTLRASQRSGDWPAFWQTQPQRRRPAVFPRRPPRTIHDPPVRLAA